MLCLLPEEKKTVYNPCCYLQVHPLFDKAESKNKLLRSVAGGGVEQIGQLQARWDKFEMMMESHELMVKEQVGKAPGQTRLNLNLNGMRCSHAVVLGLGTSILNGQFVVGKSLTSLFLRHKSTLFYPSLSESLGLQSYSPCAKCLSKNRL